MPIPSRPARPGSALNAARRAVCGLLDLIFPDTCRVCETPLVLNQPPFKISRIPVCRGCLNAPELFRAEIFCAACGTPFVNRAPLDESGRCALCRLGANGYDQVYAFGAYEGTLRKLIHVFKFEGVRTLDRPLGAFLAQALPRDASFDAIVPMPLHWRRRWRRGFNQSELLARQIARRWNIPVIGAVRRRKNTAPQAGLTSAQRRANMQGAFELAAQVRSARLKDSLKGKRLLLIDDVLTTGSTASACARVLKRAGAAHVTFLALARRDRRAGIEIETAALAAGSGSYSP